MSELGLEAALDQLTRPKRTVERFPLLLVANRLPRQVASMGWRVHWSRLRVRSAKRPC
jgi:hypothetical protein